MAKQTLQYIFIFVILVFYGNAQVIVSNKVYKSNFSNKLHEPRYVSYTLYKGGGNCDRSKFDFYNDMPNLQTATDDDYKGSIYDKGHLANAEDVAFDCEKDDSLLDITIAYRKLLT